MNRERSTCLFDRLTENGKNGKHDDHGGDNKRMRSREIQAAGGRKKSDDGGIMFLFLPQLFKKYDKEQGGHDKSQPLRVEMNERPHQSSPAGAGDPVKIVKQGPGTYTGFYPHHKGWRRNNGVQMFHRTSGK